MRVKCNLEGIEKASKVVKSGGIVVFPTDTVYGIGCDPYNVSAVEKIYKIKIFNFSYPFLNDLFNISKKMDKFHVYYPILKMH